MFWGFYRHDNDIYSHMKSSRKRFTLSSWPSTEAAVAKREEDINGTQFPVTQGREGEGDADHEKESKGEAGEQMGASQHDNDDDNNNHDGKAGAKDTKDKESGKKEKMDDKKEDEGKKEEEEANVAKPPGKAQPDAKAHEASASSSLAGEGVAAHYGTKPGHSETSKIHFPTS